MKHFSPAMGLLGGTFDPIHFGHLRLALEIRQTFALEEVKLIPCAQPVHRHQPVASALDRLAMVELAIQSEPALSILDYEIKKVTPSYTYQTIDYLRQQLPKTPFCFILGIDAFLDFPKWHHWQEIIQNAHLIVAHRHHYQLPKEGEVANLVKNHLATDITTIQQSLGGRLFFYPMTLLEIAATDIRRQLQLGLNPRYLLPDLVLDYIRQKGIYPYANQ